MIQKKSRFIFTVAMMSLLFLLFIVRLSFLSYKGIIKQKNNQTPVEAELRGLIFDRNGLPLAINQLTASLFARPGEFDEQEIKDNIDNLSRILDIPKSKLIQKISQNKKFIWLKRKLSVEVGEKIKSLKVRGIAIQNEYKRVYPHHFFASHLLGFTGIDNTGLEGLEYSYNKMLTGQENNNHRKKMIYGDNLFLTIDYQLQKIVEAVLKKGVNHFQAEGGTIIVVDSSNGEILSLANYPNYDNNHFTEYNEALFRNIAITDSYEPGSIFKMFTAAMLLEENYVSDKEHFFCNGKIIVSGREIRCTGVHGNITLRDVLKKSCNAGIIEAAQKLSKEQFFHYLKIFGFGNKSGIELAGENSGIMRPFRELTTLSKSMISFGYEITLTPLQIIMAASSIANGGKLFKPIIVKKVIGPNDQIKRISYPVLKRRTVSKQTAKKLLHLLRGVVEPGGTGARANISGLNISGKTSTTSIFNQQKGEYEENKVNTAFIGFVPLKEQTLTILVIIRKPTTQRVSSLVVAPLFKELVEKLLNKGWLAYRS